MQKVSVIGLGYIGLPTAAILAQNNVDVIGVDINSEVVNTINRGEVHIVEPDLNDAVEKAVSSGKLKATTVVEPADVFIITVPTPLTENKEPDISYVEAAIRSIAPHLREGNLVILESTSPVGTTEMMADLIADLRPDLIANPDGSAVGYKFHMAYCPERVLPGNTMNELVNNERIIGGVDVESSEQAAKFYKLFVQSECFSTNSRTAELAKLTENSYRDVNIAFANEMSMISDELDIDVNELIMLANKHPRVNILSPGPGVGGHCIAIDPWFIVDSASDSAKLIQTAREVNAQKCTWVVDKIANTINAFEANSGFRPQVVCLGLTYKANIDDVRESPSMDIVKLLLQRGNSVSVIEPNLTEEEIKRSFTEGDGNVNIGSIEEVIESYDQIFVLVAHNEFKSVMDIKNDKIRKFV